MRDTVLSLLYGVTGILQVLVFQAPSPGLGRAAQLRMATLNHHASYQKRIRSDMELDTFSSQLLLFRMHNQLSSFF